MYILYSDEPTMAALLHGLGLDNTSLSQSHKKLAPKSCFIEIFKQNCYSSYSQEFSNLW